VEGMGKTDKGEKFQNHCYINAVLQMIRTGVCIMTLTPLTELKMIDLFFDRFGIIFNSPPDDGFTPYLVLCERLPS
jgi:hypothetical protein